jgi:Sulfotransferase domain
MSKIQPESGVPLDVIGAGQGRTGTHSLKLALEQLGFGPCHHMVELVQHPEQIRLWEGVFDDEPADWEAVYSGYRSAVDAPTCFVYRQLAERYPQAKVILTVRDPESWWHSAAATTMSEELREAQIESGHPMARLRPKLAGYRERRGLPGMRPADHDGTVAEFIRHNDGVRRAISPERLLTYDVKEGWEPLCKFLGVEIPKMPFPRTNTTQEFRSRVLARRRK